LTTYGNVVESEPNNDATTATPFTPPLALNGVIEKAGDVDTFVFNAKKGDRYEVRVFARTIALRSTRSFRRSPQGGKPRRNDEREWLAR